MHSWHVHQHFSLNESRKKLRTSPKSLKPDIERIAGIAVQHCDVGVFGAKRLAPILAEGWTCCLKQANHMKDTAPVDASKKSGSSSPELDETSLREIVG